MARRQFNRTVTQQSLSRPLLPAAHRHQRMPLFRHHRGPRQLRHVRIHHRLRQHMSLHLQRLRNSSRHRWHSTLLLLLVQWRGQRHRHSTLRGHINRRRHRCQRLHLDGQRDHSAPTFFRQYRRLGRRLSRLPRPQHHSPCQRDTQRLLLVEPLDAGVIPLIISHLSHS